MVEAGPAHYDYKARLGGVEHPLRRVIIARDARASLWKTGLVVRWADLRPSRLPPHLVQPPRPPGRPRWQTPVGPVGPHPPLTRFNPRDER